MNTNIFGSVRLSLRACLLVVVTLLGSERAMGAGSPAWTPTGSLPHADLFINSVLLPNGRVLAVGVQGNYLYSPSSGTWSTGPKLAVEPVLTPPALLSTGKVLVVDNNDGRSELYNPSTNTWAFTGRVPTNSGVTFLSATAPGAIAYESGTTCINNSCHNLGKTYLYDARTGKWAKGITIPSPRTEPGQIELPNGDVLIAGGENCLNGKCTFARTGEIFHAGSNSWSFTGPLASQVVAPALTVLKNGTVLADGGAGSALLAFRVPFLKPVATAEIYNPKTNKWTSTASMTQPRGPMVTYYGLVTQSHGQSSTLLPNGNVLVTGGSSLDAILASSEIYHATLGTWSVTQPMPQPRAGHTAVLLKTGKVLVTGGQNIYDPITTSELYQP